MNYMIYMGHISIPHNSPTYFQIPPLLPQHLLTFHVCLLPSFCPPLLFSQLSSNLPWNPFKPPIFIPNFPSPQAQVSCLSYDIPFPYYLHFMLFIEVIELPQSSFSSTFVDRRCVKCEESSHSLLTVIDQVNNKLQASLALRQLLNHTQGNRRLKFVVETQTHLSILLNRSGCLFCKLAGKFISRLFRMQQWFVKSHFRELKLPRLQGKEQIWGKLHCTQVQLLVIPVNSARTELP